MFGLFGWAAVAMAGGTWVAVADGGVWADPAARDRIARRIDGEVVVVPATDLVQPGRERQDVPPAAQPGRVDDAELLALARQLEIGADNRDCAGLLTVADAVSFVDRSSVREMRYDALVAAAVCAANEKLVDAPWTERVDGEMRSIPLARAASLVSVDPSLLEGTPSAVRDELELLRGALQPTVIDVQASGWGADELEVRVDGVVLPSADGQVQVPGRHSDLQLIRGGRGRAQWGPSFRVDAGAEGFRPFELAQQSVRGLVGALATDGGQQYGGSVGAWVALVDAEALYLAVTDRRRIVLWQWQPEAGVFVPVE